jgi:hypothetical protein
VLQAGGDADLRREALGADDGGQVGVQHLDRDATVVLPVMACGPAYRFGLRVLNRRLN